MADSTEEPLLIRVYREASKLVPKRHGTDDEGRAELSVKGTLRDVLAKRLKVSGHSVDQALKQLKGKGIYRASSGGRGKPFRYFLKLDSEAEVSGAPSGRRGSSRKSSSRKSGSGAKKSGRRSVRRKAAARKAGPKRGASRHAALTVVADPPPAEMIELQPERVIEVIGGLISERDSLRAEVDRLNAEVAAREEQLRRPRPIEVPAVLLQRLEQ